VNLGAAVVGLGVGEQHARAYARTAGCRVRWLCDQDEAKARALAASLGQGQVAASFEATLADPESSIISIATYDDQHAAQVIAALNAGKHVFCEKPVCHTAGELAAIERAWRKSGRQLRCNLVLRAAPAYQWLREAIRGGEFGEIYAFDGDYLYGRLHKITGGWRKDVDDYSVLLGGGVHLVDLMMWLTGERPVTVSAIGNAIATRNTAFRYDDFAAATYCFASGAVGRITANFGCVHAHQHVVRVFGTKKTFIADDAGPRVWDARGDGQSPRRLQLTPLPVTKGDLIPPFVAAILAAADGTADTQHEIDVANATIAAHQAHRSGTTITIPYP
jgi:predicted dehydrogenase